MSAVTHKKCNNVRCSQRKKERKEQKRPVPGMKYGLLFQVSFFFFFLFSTENDGNVSTW